jgi:hypothetical protein
MTHARRSNAARRGGGGGRHTRRSIVEGIGFGLVAGVLFAVAEVVASAAMGQPGFAPFQMFASVLFGAGAFEFGAGTAILAGGLIHLVLAGLFGLIYGLLNDRLPLGSHTSWGTQAGLGVAFGAALWLVNFQIIARALFPWFLEANQIVQLLLHAIFFGLPLGLMYAAAERRALLRPGEPHPVVMPGPA